MFIIQVLYKEGDYFIRIRGGFLLSGKNSWRYWIGEG
jgi:hypothetical protein